MFGCIVDIADFMRPKCLHSEKIEYHQDTANIMLDTGTAFLYLYLYSICICIQIQYVSGLRKLEHKGTANISAHCCNFAIITPRAVRIYNPLIDAKMLQKMLQLDPL